jgi:type II secretory ATPase GspE/PulE/Tfp pilus assembly ATPase PilB-like protein
MPTKTIKKIYYYARAQGHDNIHLEKRNGKLICSYNNKSFLHLDSHLEEEIISLFRSLLKTADHEFVSNRRFKIADQNTIINGRATIMPAREGEKLIISLSSKKPFVKRLSGLGLSKEQQQKLKTKINKNTGLIILNGQEENGTTSTYYSLLNVLANKKSIYSIEDFPYHQLSHVSLINPRIYGGVSAALEQLLRLDSQIIAIDASLSDLDLQKVWQAASSRLVIMTMNYPNSAQVLKRLHQAKISTTDIASRLLLISTQKLFPRPCLKCLRPLTDHKNIKNTITRRWPIAKKFWPQKLYFNHGCKACNNKLPDQSEAIFEFMEFNPDASLKKDYQALIIEALNKASLGLINPEVIVDWAKEKN